MTAGEAGEPGALGALGALDALREVFVVIQSKANPARDVVVAVFASRERAEHYLATESHDGDLRIEPQQLLH
jgi:hypothetical protein